MACKTDHGCNRRPTQFADGLNSWKPSKQQKDAPPSSINDTHLQEFPNKPIENTPWMETSGHEPEIQPGEQITTSQLMQVLVQ